MDLMLLRQVPNRNAISASSRVNSIIPRRRRKKLPASSSYIYSLDHSSWIDGLDGGERKRDRKSRVTTVNGHQVLSSTLYSDEAVPSIMTMLKVTGETNKFKDRNDLRREEKLLSNGKTTFEHQSDCHNCHDGGLVILCSSCPRVFHTECLGWDESDLRITRNFVCPEHRCWECDRSTTMVGGNFCARL